MASSEESQTLKVSASKAARYQALSNSAKEQRDDGELNRPTMSAEPNALDSEGFKTVVFNAEKYRIRDPDDPDDVKPLDKTPMKVLHFSDGVLEVYEEDEVEDRKEETEIADKQKQSITDPKTLRWIPWMIYYAWWMGSGALGYCDYFGEKLAWALGITSPKYYYEIKAFDRMKEEEEERKKRMGIEAQGWTQERSGAGDFQLKTKQPMTLAPSNLDGDHAEEIKRVDYSSGSKSLNGPEAIPDVVDFDLNPQEGKN